MATSRITPELREQEVSTAPGSRLSALSTPGSLLDHWHLLSLDAPTVAFVWTITFAWAAGVRLPLAGPAMLALATWLLYVADRLLDSMQPAGAYTLQHRHYFHARHRRPLLLLALPATTLLTWFVCKRMDPAPRREDLGLALCALLYLLGVHLPMLRTWRRTLSLPKELCVGIIFAAACVIPAWSRQHGLHTQRPALLIVAILFALLCWLNCVAIEVWGRKMQQVSTRKIGLNEGLLLLAAVAAVSSLCFHRATEDAYAACCLCVTASALLLACLHRIRYTLEPLRLRSRADAVLLTPLGILTVSHLPWLHLQIF